MKYKVLSTKGGIIMKLKQKILSTKVVTVLATAGLLLASPAGIAHAAIIGEMQVDGHTGWCITALNGNNPGSELVLGVCAGAESQEFAYNDDNGELINEVDGLCVTYDFANGDTDGKYALLGNCVGAQNQIFEEVTNIDGSVKWVMPDRVDNAGNHIAIDNKNGTLAVNNHIDEAQVGNFASESWVGLE
jgi:hypothetical protein